MPRTPHPTTPHAEGLAHFALGRYGEALESFRTALRDSGSSELWNDWAAAQYAMGSADEAEAGFRLALKADVANGQAALNLAALLLANENRAEALSVLDSAWRHLTTNETESAAMLLQRARAAANPVLSRATIERELRKFSSADINERAYFETHHERYIETLKFLPQAKAGQKLLEVGAAFHHITPALLRLKNYSEVRCNDIWTGSAQITRELQSKERNETLSIIVDNFDVQCAPWPYADAAYDAVLFCEMLEHLHSDPMAVLAEINRVLCIGGILLLTTPNLASSHSIEYAIRGESPYIYGRFERNGKSTDRHNREYTAGEVRRLAHAAGFDLLRMETRHSWWKADRETLRLLASRGESISHRGDNIFFLGQKKESIRDRFPEEFYQGSGTQAERRSSQTADHSSGPLIAAEVPTCMKLLVIHEVVPHFDQSGSDLRLFDVLKELRAQGHQVTLLARDGKNRERYSRELENLGIRVIAGDPSRLKHLGVDHETNWSFAELLQSEYFDVAILFHWFWSGISIPEHYLSEIRRYSPSTRIAILTDDRHGERELRSAKLSGLFSDLERANDFESRELAAYRAADLVLYITEADHMHFSSLIPDVPMEHLPIVTACSSDESPGFVERSGVLFLGNFENLANRDALDWLLRDIWPLIHNKRPHLTLYVAGNACPQNFGHSDKRIVSLGTVPSLEQAFRDRLALVAPIRFGTGINTKNLQALAHGLPVITTSIGAEGLQLQNCHHAAIADSSHEFADSVLKVCSDFQLWQKLATNGKSLVAAEFSPQRLSRRLQEILIRASSTITPKLFTRDELPSYLAVENINPDLLIIRPANYRFVLRTSAYWQYGSAELARGNARHALEQFRHIFTTLRGALPDTVFHHRLLSDIAAAYRSLGNSASALRCERESKNLVPLHRSVLPAPNRPLRKFHSQSGHTPKLSVVLPTFNRRQTLSLALTALAFQTLPSEAWEVIVIDDGSQDGTAEFLRSAQFPFRLRVLSQLNLGAGAARSAGVAAARGEIILLCNDDTIAGSTLLEEHLQLHQQHAKSKLAILGHFYPSSECGRRALSFWINHSPFLFPQQTLQPGQICDSAFFVTCNLSVRREALLEAGNFDPAFRVAEDTDMGARLAQRGYHVRFEPSAAATHEHSTFTTADLLRRAALYGPATWRLLNKHPQLLAHGSGPFGKLRESDLRRISSTQLKNAQAANAGIEALRTLDDFDISSLWNADDSGIRPVDSIVEKVSAIVPIVYWHCLLEHFLAAAGTATSPETNLDSSAVTQAAAL